MTDEQNVNAVSDEEIAASLEIDDGSLSDDEEKTDTDSEPADDADANKGEGDPADTDPDTVDDSPALDPLQKQFQDLGLKGEYADVADVLSRVHAKNAYMDDIQKKNAALLQRLELLEVDKAKREQLSPEALRDQFEENPADAMKRAGFVSRDELKSVDDQLTRIEERQREESWAGAAAAYPELKDVAIAIRAGRNPVPGSNPIWDEMRKTFHEFPALANMPFDQILGMTFEPAKARVAAGKRPAVNRVSPKDKAGANTTAGDTATRTASDEPDFNNMTSGEIRAHYQKQGKVAF